MGRIAAILIVLLSGCQGRTNNGAIRTQALSDVEALAGSVADALETHYGGTVSDRGFQERLQRVTLGIVRANPTLSRDYHFAKLQDAGINAFSLPPGRIYLTRGLFQRIGDDAQLAAVICHEIAHIARRDHFDARCTDPVCALEREIDTDALAREYLIAAALGVDGLREVIELIRDEQPAGWADQRLAALGNRE